MVSAAEPDTNQLLLAVASGDVSAADRLLARHRGRLRKMVAVRLDRRVARRVDPSDIVQDTLAQAAKLLPEYVRDRPLPFYPWIRQIALRQVVRQHRRHLSARGRSVRLEEREGQTLPDHSAIALAARLLDGGADPGDAAVTLEARAKVRRVLTELSESDREVLVLRYLERLTTAETAAVLGLTLNGVKSRQARALERFVELYSGRRPGEGR